MRISLRTILLAVTLIVTAEALSQNADSLLTRFKQQSGTEARATAERFLSLVEREGLSDGKVELKPDCSAESIRLLTWYWASEWYFDLQDYSNSLQYAQQAFELCKTAGTPEIEADICSIISILHFRKTDYPQALKYAERTLKIAREMKDRERMAYSLNTLAGISLASGSAEEGKKYIVEAIRICREDKDSLKLAVRLGMASEIYQKCGNLEESIKCAEEAYNINMQMGLPDKAAIRLSQLAAAQIAKQEYESARNNLLKALPMLRNCGNKQSEGITLNQLGDIALHYEQDSLAAGYFDSALQIFTQKGDLYNKCRSHLGLSRALMRDDPKVASSHLLAYSNLKDSIYNNNLVKSLNELHAKYKNEELARKLDKQRSDKITLLIICIFTTIILFIAIRLLRRKLYRTMGSLRETVNSLKEAKRGLERGLKDKEDALPDSNWLLDAFKQEVERRMASGDIDLQAIASSLCMTRTHLNRKIKSITGKSCSTIISEMRIERAKRLLRDERGKSVAEISLLCGIEDTSYFISIFKRITGTTPKQWRESH